jgi:hypothetical protein
MPRCAPFALPLAAQVDASGFGPWSVSGLSNGSRVEPDDDGRDDDQRPIVNCAFLVAGRQPTPLFEAIDTPLDQVAPGIDGFVEEERPSWPNCSLRTLVASLWNGVRDLSLPQPAATEWVTVALVGDEAVGAGPRSAAATRSGDPDAVEDRSQLGAVMILPWGNHDREGSPFSVTSQMELGGQPSPATAEALVDQVYYPLFRSA